MDGHTPAPGLQKIPVSNLVLGMYVAELDRPWLDSPYPIQGFYVRSEINIRKLAEECSFVYVDPRRYDTRIVDVDLQVVPQGKSERKPRDNVVRLKSARPRRPKTYRDSVEIREELVPAQTSLEDAVDVMKSVVDKLQKTGGIQFEDIETAIKPLVNSVMRNKVAIAALLRIRSLGEYSYAHALACAVWAALLARELGFSRSDIDRLAMGCSLLDIGKVQIPTELLESPEPLTPDQWTIMHTHVDAGLELAKEAGVEDAIILQMLKTHHERHDGSGYPQGLQGNAIPVFGRIAGIVDSYDAMISERPYSKAISSFAAIRALQSRADELYQEEIVEHFIKAIGVFPAGTIVELNTGEVAVVVSQNGAWRLKPKVMLILEENKQIRTKFVVIDLASTGGRASPTIWITKEHPAHAFGIDPGKYFL
ncbi:MAG: HD-GYP domain-containing protein [Gammaproteobacteria bacterium]|nr:HD-GYP domain-containing protein [Gammaproteobacteria bacterium]